MVIVAAVDRSDRAGPVIEEASDLARATGDEIRVVHVLTRGEFVDLGRASVDETGEGVHPDRVREIAGEIAAEVAAESDAAWEAVGLMGDPADRVVDYAREHNARYVVVQPRRRSPAGKALFGSVAQSVLLDAPCTVVIPPGG